MAPLPHESVYVRLAPSKIHGVGVFAICEIPSGTEIFATDRIPFAWVDDAELHATMSEQHARLYADFGVRRAGRIGCPVNFNNLTPGWYLNRAPLGRDANVRSDAELRFFASRDIAEGEELTLNYLELGDPPRAGS